jgi:tRNA (guanine37-N1)-methyltransferase
MTEAIARLIPGVIKETESRQEESYSLKENMENLEAPQYTRPEEVYGYRVPEILLTGNEQEIAQRKKEKSKNLTQLAESSSE